MMDRMTGLTHLSVCKDGREGDGIESGGIKWTLVGCLTQVPRACTAAESAGQTSRVNASERLVRVSAISCCRVMSRLDYSVVSIRSELVIGLLIAKKRLPFDCRLSPCMWSSASQTSS